MSKAELKLARDLTVPASIAARTVFIAGMKVKLSPNVILPSELSTRRSAIFGISGSGKSNTAFRCIEQLLTAGEQVILIDPKGEGWGLQTSRDGKRAAFDIIVFGQPHGDIPELREEHAAQIADFVVDSGRSVVLSLLGFETDQSERRFVTEFFKRLYRRKSQQAAKTRTLVVLEEAHLFVPEKADGKAGEMVGAIKRIARQGRAAGIGLMTIDQRPQEVAKSIISQAELLICHQLVHKLDREALREWVRAYDREGQGEAFLESLAELAPGEAWAWSPAWLHLFTRTTISLRETYDSGATPDGSLANAPTAKAKVDLDALRSHLARVVDQAKATDPKALQAKVAELQRQLAARPAAEPKVVEKPVVTDAQLKEFSGAVAAMEREGNRRLKVSDDMMATAKELAESGRQLVQQAGQFASAMARAVGGHPHPVARPTATRPAAIVPRVTVIRTPPVGEEDGGMKPVERALLTAMAQHPEGLSKQQACIYAGYKPAGGVSAAFARFEREGWTENRNGLLVITDGGVSAVGPFEPLPTGSALREKMLQEASPVERALLAAIFNQWPDSMAKGRVVEVSGYKPAGGVSAAFAKFRRLGWVTLDRGQLRASETLFDAVTA